ncbi:MAG: cobalamin biosynthesis protein CobD [Arcobacteraceae bacterium]|nr:cobalamin biosynthesis protein CobD [Arcobacteraceae bacterium]
MYKGFVRVYLEITLIAFIIDRVFSEFKYIRHPVVLMGNFIKWFENNFYKDNIINGIGLTVSLLLVVGFVVFVTKFYIDNIFILGLIASTTIASKMLYESVKDIISNPQNIKFLVSRDTKELSNSDINKAAIETYGENLSDGVVAPIFYLLLFGLYGAFIYKAINTLDSMVGYRNERYENFGKFSAKLDDIVNFIPSRITAFLISFLMLSTKAYKNIFKYGKLHESPNAGFPISAIAGVCDISLGGDTSYFGKVKSKPYFGDGNKEITTQHINKALEFQIRLDIFIIIVLGSLYVL